MLRIVIVLEGKELTLGKKSLSRNPNLINKNLVILMQVHEFFDFVQIDISYYYYSLAFVKIQKSKFYRFVYYLPHPVYLERVTNVNVFFFWYQQGSVSDELSLHLKECAANVAVFL